MRRVNLILKFNDFWDYLRLRPLTTNLEKWCEADGDIFGNTKNQSYSQDKSSVPFLTPFYIIHP